MSSRPPGAALRQVRRLFGRGTVSGLVEGQLLERFVALRDEAAFEALVARFGPMVLAACRRVLADRHDVEDAFQATFLVLARRAASIRDPVRLGPWLHGVASRVAVRARADAARRRDRDRLVAREEAVMGPTPRLEWDEARPILDEEVRRLPEPFRVAIVLCHLEGLTHEEAADRLRCPVGTVRSRLARGRERLRRGLARRGVTLPGAALGSLLASESAPAAPPMLAASVTSAAIRFATGGAIPSMTTALAEEVLKAMTTTRLKVATAALAVMGLAATGAGVLAYRGAGDPQEPAGSKAPPAKADEVAADAPAEGGAGKAVDPSAMKRLRERVHLARQVFEFNEGRLKVGEAGLSNDRLYLWSRRLWKTRPAWAGDRPTGSRPPASTSTA